MAAYAMSCANTIDCAKRTAILVCECTPAIDRNIVDRASVFEVPSASLRRKVF